MIRTYIKLESQAIDVDYGYTCFNWHVLSVGLADSQGRQLVKVSIVTDFEGVDLAEEAIAVLKQAKQDSLSGNPWDEVVEMMKVAMTTGELSSFLLGVRLLN